MSYSYVFKDKPCNDLYLEDLSEVIEHLRTHYGEGFIRRPGRVGDYDSHGNVWYCFRCTGKLGQDHRSCRSHRDMWNHIEACHDWEREYIYRAD